VAHRHRFPGHRDPLSGAIGATDTPSPATQTPNVRKIVHFLDVYVLFIRITFNFSDVWGWSGRGRGVATAAHRTVRGVTVAEEAVSPVMLPKVGGRGDRSSSMEYGFIPGTLSPKAQAKRDADTDAAFVAPRPKAAPQVAVNVTRKRTNVPASAEQVKAAEQARAKAPSVERMPHEPYVWATVKTGTGFYAAEMRASAVEALRASGEQVTVRDERPKSEGVPAYVPPPAACRSQNYNRRTIWQKAQQTRVYLPK